MPEYTIVNGWICELVEECTCAGVDQHGHPRHEPGCGAEHLVTVEDALTAHARETARALLRDAQARERAQRAAEGLRVHIDYEDTEPGHTRSLGSVRGGGEVMGTIAATGILPEGMYVPEGVRCWARVTSNGKTMARMEVKRRG